MNKIYKLLYFNVLFAKGKNMKRNNLYRVVLPILIMCIALSSCSGPSKKRSSTVVPINYPYASKPVSGEGMYHTVAPGETLWRISKMYGVDQDVLISVNQIKDVSNVEIGTKIYIPNASPMKHVITLYPSNKWKYIVVHHSATDMGSAEIFNTAHKNRGWDEIGYHFVIDNDTAGKSDGQIEIGPRWTKQVDGAHCKAASMNERGIGICLVGNFSKTRPTAAQMNSLVDLVNILRKYYGIPKYRIQGHGQVSGAKTECPGKMFPWNDFMSRLGK